MKKIMIALCLILPGILMAGFDYSGAHSGIYGGDAPASTKSASYDNSSEKVVLFMNQTCPYCAKARLFLQSNNIPFTEIDIQKRPGDAQRHRINAVPTIFYNGKRYSGFSSATYRKIFNR